MSEHQNGTVSTERHSSEEDILGQFPQLKSYNQALLCFPLSDDISRDDIRASLTGATAKVIEKVPWLGRQVVNEGKGPGSSGVFKTVPWPRDASPNTLLYFRDCEDLCPSYDEMAKAWGPIYMFDGSVLCPLPGFPLSYEEKNIGPAPVVAVQASFIKGGVILNFSNQHNMVDGTGVFVFIMLLALAMQGKELPHSIVEQANIGRGGIVPLLASGEPMRDHSHLYKPVPVAPPQSPGETKRAFAPAKWVIFRLSSKAIPDIKLAASHREDYHDPSVEYVSTNDALCAFYWKRLASVRLNNGTVEAAAVSKFSRAIDARSAVGAPPGYMGQMVYHAATRLSYGELAGDAGLSLSAIASRMRADLNASNNEWAVRSYATFLAGVPDKSTLVYGGGINPALDVGSSSMSQSTSGRTDFGILGVPTMARRPDLAPIPGLLYFFPQEGNSKDMPVLVCLNEKDIAGLKEDKEWGSYAEFIG